MWLAIDDVRNPFVDVIVRTPEAAKIVLKEMEFEVLLLDHDLGHQVETGYDLVKWAYKNDVELPPRVQIISSNPVGRDNIFEFLKNSCGYRSFQGRNYDLVRD